MKYLVMECHPGYVVLLDEEGRFVKAANFSYEVGQRIDDPILMERPSGVQRQRKKRPVHWKLSLAALAACMVLVVTGYYYNFMRAYAEVYLTINPAVCMELNRQGGVLSLRAMNKDGEALLEGYDPAGRSRIEVADELIERAIQQGYLTSGGRVTIELNVPDEKQLQRYRAEYEASVNDYLEGYSGIEVIVIDQNAPAGDDPAEETVPPEVITVPPQATQSEDHPSPAYDDDDDDDDDDGDDDDDDDDNDDNDDNDDDDDDKDNDDNDDDDDD